MIGFLCLVIGVGLGCVIGRGTAPLAVATEPVVLFEAEDFRAKYRERQRDLRAQLHRMRAS